MTPSRSTGPLLAVLCLAAGFAVARLGVAGLVARVEPEPPPVPQIDETWSCWEAGRDTFDVVCVGSSLTWRHLDPTAVAEGAAGAGATLRSYTMGVQGMTAFEQEHLVDRLLAERPEGLRAIVLEARPAALVGWANAYSDRTLRGATWDGTREAVGFHLASDEKTGKRLERAGPFAAAWLARSTGTGDLSRALVPPVGARDVPEAAHGCAHDGFWPLEWSTEPDVRDRRARFLERDGPLPLSDDPPEPPDPVWVAHYRTLVERVRAAGLACVVYVPPSVLQLEPLRDLVAAADEVFAGAPVVSFLPEDLGADLYTRDVRFDAEHLLLPAARDLSRRLGRALADHLP